MDFSEEQASGVQSNALPQFSELASRSNAIGASVSAEYTSGGNMQSQAVQTLAYTTAANMNQKSVFFSNELSISLCLSLPFVDFSFVYSHPNSVTDLFQ